jgi:hypothetical protein
MVTTRLEQGRSYGGVVYLSTVIILDRQVDSLTHAARRAYKPDRNHSKLQIEQVHGVIHHFEAL